MCACKRLTVWHRACFRSGMMKTNTTAKLNSIAIQDAYIERVAKLDPKSRNYVVNVSKAWKVALNAILDWGFSRSEAERMVFEAHDLAQLTRFSNGL